MKIKSILTAITLGALCAIKASAVVPLGAGFTYQGKLNDAGAPANGNYDMIFNLYDAPTNGNVLGSFSIFGAVPVSNGLFTLELNSYGEFGPSAFNGQARWLQMGVRTNNNNALNPWIYLNPRQPLDPTPQAMFALNASNSVNASFAANASFASSVADGSITSSKLAPGAVQAGNLAPGAVAWSSLAGIPAGFADGVDNDTTYAAGLGLTLSGAQFNVNFAGTGSANSAARSDHQHFGALWGGSTQYGNGLSVTNGAPNSAGLYGQQGTGSGFPYIFGNTAGVWGESSQGSGVHGASGYNTGSGVVGFGVATNGANRGVSGTTFSTIGTGVYGNAATASGANFGVQGVTASTAGTGVSGMATAASGATVGVSGKSDSSQGIGVSGRATTLSGATCGVFGQSDSSLGVGVFGKTPFASGTNYGVVGQSDSYWGAGVYGHAAATGGANSGVMGQSDSVSGVGVLAKNTNGVAFKAAGTGIIQSDADSWVWIPGAAAFGGGGYYGATLDINSYTWADFPLTIPTMLYGQRTVLKSIEVCYSCEDGSKGYIEGTALWDDTLPANTYFYQDSTHRTSNTGTSYTIPLNYTFSNSSGFLLLGLTVHGVNNGSVWIRGLKLRFGHT